MADLAGIVEAVRVGHGETLVVRLRHDISEAEAEQIRDRIQGALPPCTNVTVLGGAVAQLAVIEAADNG